MFDRSISWALIANTSDLYNEHIAGKPVGDFDVTAPCAEGGTARITGSVATPGNMGGTNVDLAFDMNACHAVLSYPVPGGTSTTSLRTTGVLRWTGSFSATTTNMEYRSTGSLAVQGTLGIFINKATRLDPAIDESCVFAARRTGTLLSGTYCDRPLSL